MSHIYCNHLYFTKLITVVDIIRVEKQNLKEENMN